MRLGKSEIESLDRAAGARFHEHLMTFLREELPKETCSIDDEALRERIQQSEKQATRYGIRSEQGIAQYTCLTFAVGVPLDEIPEIRAYLETPGLNGDDKIDELVDYLEAIEDGTAVPLDEEQLYQLRNEADED